MHSYGFRSIKELYDCALYFILGKGTYNWKANGALYDGDWKCGKRSGYGTYSLPKGDGTYNKIYSGGWKNDKRHVRYDFFLYV